MKGTMWKCQKRKARDADTDDEEASPSVFPLIIPKGIGGSSHGVYSHMNHVYFNDDITSESAFALCKELRSVESQMKVVDAALSLDQPRPIYLHITTHGGCIHSAFTVVDTIENMSCPVHTVVEGFVASAGTLISLAGEERTIAKNAYMLIHELRSGVWGKMSNIEEEYQNLKKLMDHIKAYYTDKTSIKSKELDKILKQDVVWNASECIDRGLVNDVYTTSVHKKKRV